MPDLAWKVYRSCAQSSSSPEFARVATEVSDLHVALRTTREMLESDTFSMDYRSKIHELAKCCYEALQDLLYVIDDYKAIPSKNRRSWDRMGFESNKLPGVRERLQSNISLVNELNTTLSRCVIQIVSSLD